MWNTSLWDYKKGGFRQLINTINDKSVPVPHALANFREVDQLPHKFKQLKVQEISSNPNLILELWSSRTNMPAEKEYRLGCKKAYREKQLIDSLAETYPIDTKLAKSKVVLGRYSDDERTFCYAIEVSVAPRTDLGRNHAGQIEIIDSVNNNASSDGDGSYFSGGSYRWEADSATILLVTVSGFMPQPFEAYYQNVGSLLVVATQREENHASCS